MIFFGHIGITLGAATLAAQAFSRQESGETRKKSWFTALTSYLDIRLLIIGSILPDLIDKPIGQIFFRAEFHNGRIFAHTLLFLLILAAIGFYLYKRYGQKWMLILAAGVFMHQLLDFMWQTPGTFFWPLLGFKFARYELDGWFANIFKALLESPFTFYSEVIGFIIFIWFIVWVSLKNKLGNFLLHGKTV
jgi:inner membrane protein